MELEVVNRLTKDLKTATVSLSRNEARYMVDAYYTMQDSRIRSHNQERALDESGESHKVITWFAAQHVMLENQVKRALDAWGDAHPVGVWAKSICGIGPVISAGLLANVDITRAESAGNIWSFAGLAPQIAWNKGEKRPFNADFKTLCSFKLGECFVKVQNNENDHYGRMYAKRKKIEIERNDAGEFADQAVAKLQKFKIGKTTEAYKHYSAGRLPPAHIHARARRYAVKIFLSDYHLVAYYHHFGTMPALPYVFEHMVGHVHYVPPPNLDLIPGLPEAMVGYLNRIRARDSRGAA